MRLLFCLVGAVLFFALSNSAGADLVTYQYNGPTALNSMVKNTTVEVVWTIDTTTPATVISPTNYRYDDAIVFGYYKIGSTVYPFDPAGAQNDVIVRTNVYDINKGVYFNALYIHISTDGVMRNGLTPSSILVNLFDFDTPRDSIISTDLVQPLETIKGYTNGGIDSLAFGMGAYNGSIVSTVTSGQGSIVTIPEPATIALLTLGATSIVQRRRD